jgi:hypothetical protein
MGEKIKMIKKEAIVDIKIGVAFIERIQKLLVFVISGLTEEQLQQFKTESEGAKDNTNFQYSEPWMDSLLTLSVLLKEIEEKAEAQGFVKEEDIDNINL